jgi:hypothetical protein
MDTDISRGTDPNTPRWLPEKVSGSQMAKRTGLFLCRGAGFLFAANGLLSGLAERRQRLL